MKNVTEKKAPHTQGEWKTNFFDIFAQDHQCIATVHGWSPEANAKRIVKCVNAHDDLVGMLKRIVASDHRNITEWNHMRGMAVQILNQAEQD